MKGALSKSSWQALIYTAHHWHTHPARNLCKKDRVHFVNLWGTKGARLSKKQPPSSTSPEIINTAQCTEPGGKGSTRKRILGKLGNRRVRSSRRWNNNKNKGKYLSEPLSITNFYSRFPKMKETDTKPYRGLVDWRKIGLVVGVENTLVKPQPGERYSPCRNRGHIKCASDKAVILTLPFPFLLSAVFLSLSEVKDRWEPLDLCSSFGNC